MFEFRASIMGVKRWREVWVYYVSVTRGLTWRVAEEPPKALLPTEMLTWAKKTIRQVLDASRQKPLTTKAN